MTDLFCCSLLFWKSSRIVFPFNQLTDGHAEMFGTELTKGKKYAFSPGAKVAAFTWQGCIILISFLNHLFSLVQNLTFDLSLNLLCTFTFISSLIFLLDREN